MDDLRAHLLLWVATVEEISEVAEAKDPHASRRVTWLANPDILTAIDLGILWIALLESLVNLVSLVHDVSVGHLPPMKLQNGTVIHPLVINCLHSAPHNYSLFFLLLTIAANLITFDSETLYFP